jgi:hypothetical protein
VLLLLLLLLVLVILIILVVIVVVVVVLVIAVGAVTHRPVPRHDACAGAVRRVRPRTHGLGAV